MDRTQVAAHYHAKGYRVHESMVVEGRSGNHRIPMLCEGPLGNLTVFFGDAGGIDSPEIGAAKRIARDLGATAVVAAEAFTGEQRKTAAELGVVLVDAATLAEPAPAAPAPSTWPANRNRGGLDEDLAAHPWPDSGRPGGFDGPSRNVTYEVDEVLARFDRPTQTPLVAVTPTVAPATVAATPAATPTATSSPRVQPTNLWRHPRGDSGPTAAATTFMAAPTSTPKSNPRSTAATRFAWLNLPPTPEAVPDAEYEGLVSAHQRVADAPAATETPPALRDPRIALRRRRLVRRLAWTAGAALFVYLFLLWWL